MPLSLPTQKNCLAQELHSGDAISSPISLCEIKRRVIRYLDAFSKFWHNVENFKNYRGSSRNKRNKKIKLELTKKKGINVCNLVFLKSKMLNYNQFVTIVTAWPSYSKLGHVNLLRFYRFILFAYHASSRYQTLPYFLKTTIRSRYKSPKNY